MTNPSASASDDARVRDHLANERTFLAWIRTGIATMGFGVVIARLRYLFPPGTVSPPSRGIIHAANIGLLFTVIGLAAVVLALLRYRVVQRQLREQCYRSSDTFLLLFAVVIVLLGLLIIGYLLQSSAATPS